MPERRVAQIMCQTSRGDNLADRIEFSRPRLPGMTLAEHDGRLCGERAAYAGHLDRMGKTVVDEYASRQRKHLGLVLQPPEGRREHQTVIVALEIAAHPAPRVVVILKSEALVAYQAVPVHCHEL